MKLGTALFSALLLQACNGQTNGADVAASAKVAFDATQVKLSSIEFSCTKSPQLSPFKRSLLSGEFAGGMALVDNGSRSKVLWKNKTIASSGPQLFLEADDSQFRDANGKAADCTVFASDLSKFASKSNENAAQFKMSVSDIAAKDSPSLKYGLTFGKNFNTLPYLALPFEQGKCLESGSVADCKGVLLSSAGDNYAHLIFKAYVSGLTDVDVTKIDKFPVALVGVVFKSESSKPVATGAKTGTDKPLAVEAIYCRENEALECLSKLKGGIACLSTSVGHCTPLLERIPNPAEESSKVKVDYAKFRACYIKNLPAGGKPYDSSTCYQDSKLNNGQSTYL